MKPLRKFANQQRTMPGRPGLGLSPNCLSVI
jgi:hypothetical protein